MAMSERRLFPEKEERQISRADLLVGHRFVVLSSSQRRAKNDKETVWSIGSRNIGCGACAVVSVGTGAPVPAQLEEAPMLAELVATGELPPLEERLPKDVMVVEPYESLGQFGGTWHRAFLGVKDFHALGRLIYDNILRWPLDPADPIGPGLAKTWEWSADGKTLTLNLREGLKWSDGEPFTVDDIIFWWEDIENDPEITAAPHSEWVVAGQPMELEKVSDTTINLNFAAPNGLAETVGLAFHGCQWPLGFERFGFFAPRHYLRAIPPQV